MRFKFIIILVLSVGEIDRRYCLIILPVLNTPPPKVQKEYSKDPWNLTGFADLYQSVLKYIVEPISGTL